MTTEKVSIIIPARNEDYLYKTVDSLLQNATGEIEIIIILDGYWPISIDCKDSRAITIHFSDSRGMRSAINTGARMAKGKYLMKIDAHCMVGKGYDELLKKELDVDSLAIPSRYALDVEKWASKNYVPPVEYLYLTYPYIKEEQFGLGLHGKKWTGETKGKQGWWEPERTYANKKIDEIMTWQGSCWFMHRDKFFDIDCLDTMYSYNMYQEAIELGFKIWLSGGKLLVNKNTWYAHWHKVESSNYNMSKQAKLETEAMSTWFWMQDKWSKKKYDIKWFINKFWPIPTWPDNWEKDVFEQRKYVFKPKIVNKNGHNGLGL
jgi:glycosyltransferase involved in cell wall biosynthesis